MNLVIAKYLTEEHEEAKEEELFQLRIVFIAVFAAAAAASQHHGIFA